MTNKEQCAILAAALGLEFSVRRELNDTIYDPQNAMYVATAGALRTTSAREQMACWELARSLRTAASDRLGRRSPTVELLRALKLKAMASERNQEQAVEALRGELGFAEEILEDRRQTLHAEGTRYADACMASSDEVCALAKALDQTEPG